jgi:hypothetical protein
MSRLVARILLSVFMFPLGVIVYVLVFVVGAETLRGNRYSPGGETELFLASGAATWAFVAAYWCLLWRSSVRWDSRRVVGTGLGAAGALGGGLFAGLCASVLVPRSGSGFGAFIGGVLAIVLWLIATVVIWRETPAERAQRVRGSSRSAITCPTCGYNLTGLSESRCPECGSKFTLDELLALQNKVEVEIE